MPVYEWGFNNFINFRDFYTTKFMYQEILFWINGLIVLINRFMTWVLMKFMYFRNYCRKILAISGSWLTEKAIILIKMKNYGLSENF